MSVLRAEDLVVAHALAARRRALSAAETAAAVRLLQDSYAVGLAGSRVPQAAAIKAACLGGGGGNGGGGNGSGGEARVWGSGEQGAAAAVALVNAWQIHNQEWDCVHEPAVVHPMAVPLAALTAVAERTGGGAGDRFLRAIAAGIDIAATLGQCASGPLRFFRPAWCGGIGAVAALAVWHDADETTLRDAFGLVYGALGGTMQAHVEGVMALPLQIAFAARSAVTAFDLALGGISGPRQWLSGEFGFFRLIEAGDNAPAALGQLGGAGQLPQVSQKPFPTGRAAHGGLHALRQIMVEEALAADQVEAVVLTAPPLICRLVGRPAAPTMAAGYARLCFPWLAATMLLTGDVGVADYDCGRIADPRRQALAAKVRLEADGNPDPNAMTPQRLTVRRQDGREHSLSLAAVLGSPECPLDGAAHRAKFERALAAAVRPVADPEALFTAIAALATGGGTAAVTERL